MVVCSALGWRRGGGCGGGSQNGSGVFLRALPRAEAFFPSQWLFLCRDRSARTPGSLHFTTNTGTSKKRRLFRRKFRPWHFLLR